MQRYRELITFLKAEKSKSDRLLNVKHKESYDNRLAKIRNRERMLNTEREFYTRFEKFFPAILKFYSDINSLNKAEALAKEIQFLEDPVNKEGIDLFNAYLDNVENLLLDQDEITGRSSTKKSKLPSKLDKDELSVV